MSTEPRLPEKTCKCPKGIPWHLDGCPAGEDGIVCPIEDGDDD